MDDAVVKAGVRKIFTAFGWMFYASAVAVYLSYLLGSRYFILPQVPLPFWAENVLNVAMFTINLFFCLSICLDEYSKKIWKHVFILLLICLSIYSLRFFAEFNLIAITGLAPLAYVLIANIFSKRNTKRKFIKTALFCFVSYVYQFIMCQVKMGVLRFAYAQTTSVEGILFSIDLYVMFSLLYFWKGGGSYADVPLVHLNRGRAFDAPEVSDAEAEEIAALNAQFSALSRREKTKTRIRFAAIYLGQIFLVLLVISIVRGWISALILLPSFWIFNSIIKNRYHSKTTMTCTLISLATFFFAACGTIPYKYSIYSVFVSAFAITYALFRVQAFIEYSVGRKEDIEPFRCSTATTQEIMARGMECGMKDEDIDFICRSYRTKTTYKEYAAEYFVTEQAIKKRKERLIKRLES